MTIALAVVMIAIVGAGVYVATTGTSLPTGSGNNNPSFWYLQVGYSVQSGYNLLWTVHIINATPPTLSLGPPLAVTTQIDLEVRITWMCGSIVFADTTYSFAGFDQPPVISTTYRTDLLGQQTTVDVQATLQVWESGSLIVSKSWSPHSVWTLGGNS